MSDSKEVRKELSCARRPNEARMGKLDCEEESEIERVRGDTVITEHCRVHSL